MPNARGAGILGFERSDDPYAEVRGHDGVLFVLEDDPDAAGEVSDVGRDAALFVYIGTHMTPAARDADIVLPNTTFAEAEGTFVNFEGRVQRFTQALHAPGLARPLWMSGSAALKRLGSLSDRYPSAAAAFADLAAESSEFAGLSYARLGLSGALVASAGTETPVTG